MRRIVMSNRLCIALALFGPVAPAFAQAGRPKAATPAPAKAKAAATKPAAAPKSTLVPQAQGPEAEAKLDDLLKRWETNSASVKSLDLDFIREDVAVDWGDVTEFRGRALLKSPNFAWLDSNKVALGDNGKKIIGKDGKPEVLPHERIVCTGDEVWQYMAPTHQIIVHPLSKEAKQRALEEGPLPFMFNMKAEQARQRYDLKLEGENATLYAIDVKPLQEIDKESFSSAKLYLDKKLLQPVMLVLVDVNERDKKRYRFLNIKPNVKVADSTFRGGEIKGWKLERGDAAAKTPTQPVRAAVKGPARQSAIPPARPAGRPR